MRYEDFSKAIDTVMKMCKVSEDVAIDTVSALTDIFGLTASENVEEMEELFFKAFLGVL